jgi:ubiquinone/menaquinone biosynthesis C-methylase UbiE
MTDRSDPVYTLGRSQEETERLTLQGQLYEPPMRMAFESAGVVAGMKVLDVGSGAGDVAMLAAKMVGASGCVVGVDTNPEVLNTARQRVAVAGLSNVTFLDGDIRTVSLPDDFDAVVGRAVLMYQADPVKALRQAGSHVCRGGIVLFAEWETRAYRDYCSHFPELRLTEKTLRLIVDAFAKTGADSALGYKLYGLFIDAGLPEPFVTATTIMGGRSDWPGFQNIAGTVKSVIPVLEKFGLATADELRAETLAQRLRSEVVATRLPIPCGTLVYAWAEKP